MKIIKALLLVVLILVLAAGGLAGYLTLTEYRPDDIELLEVTQAARSDNVRVGERLDVLTFNTGYCGLGRDQDFFMDGGSMVRPESEEIIRENMNGILSELARQNADVYLLQEVDFDSYRSYYVNQADTYRHGLSLNMAVAYNFKCDFVPFPWPPLRKVESGLVSFTGLNVTQATRESLPVPFTWPTRVGNLKRCLLVERIPVADSGRELVLINLHLEAYDDGEGKVAQTRQLLDFIHQEYEKGNYVIAGGDFNQTFEGVQRFGGSWEGKWTPGVFTEDELPQGVRLVYDPSLPTCRSLDQAYIGDRDNHVFYLIDGFLVTDNVQVEDVHTVDLDFAYSDHNPMLMQVTLL